MAPKVSLTIVSNEIVFSITEMGFIKKHLHWKYPAAMGDLIDATRVLMRDIQKLAKQDYKLTYTASRYHPDDDARFIVYELLGHENAGLRSLVAMQPVEAERRGHFRNAATKGLIRFEDVMKQLHQYAQDESLENHSSPGGLKALAVLSLVVKYLDSVASQVVIQSFGLSRDNKDIVTLSMDLGHSQSMSHYVRLSFDFALPATSVTTESSA